MSTKSKFVRSRNTIKEFEGVDKENDNGKENNAGDNTAKTDNAQGSAPAESGFKNPKEARQNNAGSLVQASSHAPSHLLLVSLLEHVCSIYVPDARKSRAVFKLLHKELVKLNILMPVGGLDEITNIRSDYRRAFRSLFQSAVEAVYDNSQIPVIHMPDTEERSPILCQPRDLVRAHQRFSLEEFLGIQSRYHEEFIELEKLGKGAYGSVFKCKHKLDGCIYAIKKIKFGNMKIEGWFKVLREVKYLAGVDHENVVRYHGAWLEYLVPKTRINRTVYSPFSTMCTNQTAANLQITHHKDESYSSLRRPTVYREDDSLDVVFAETPSAAGTGQVVTGDQSEESSSSAQQSLPQSDNSNDYIMDQIPFVVLHIQMQVCDKTLKEWLSDRNYNNSHTTDKYDIIDENENQIVLRQILKAMDHIHRQNLIHRDLKPKNIFLVDHSSGILRVQVGDFGLARHILSDEAPLTPHPGRSAFDDRDHSEHNYTTGIGTTIYASPEQLSGTDYNSKSDIYSFGLILFELYQPFGTEMERQTTLNEARKGTIPDEFRLKWPLQAEYLDQLLSEEPNERPSAIQLLESNLFLPKDELSLKLQVEVVRQTNVIKRLEETIRKIQNENKELKLKLHQKDQQLAVKDRQLDDRKKH